MTEIEQAVNAIFRKYDLNRDGFLENEEIKTFVRESYGNGNNCS